MPSIWKAPSPIMQTTVRSEYANFAAVAYGIAENIEAFRPEMSPFMPRRSRMWWPYQSAVVPTSVVTMASSGSRAFSSWTTLRGFTPSG